MPEFYISVANWKLIARGSKNMAMNIILLDVTGFVNLNKTPKFIKNA
jgi:hypothetical protein